MSKKINIQFITGSRADYGIMSDLLDKLKNNKSINLSITAIGSHFSTKYGNTAKEIQINNKRIKKLKINFKTKNFMILQVFAQNL